MKNYRLGNTITVKWTIMTATGTAYNLNVSNLELFAVVPNHAIKVDDFSVEGNVITWTFMGTDQKFTGPYTLTLIENRGQSTMMTVDYCNAFGLVRWSCQAGWDESADVDSNLSLTSEIFTHQIALSKEVQAVIEGNITEYNVSNHYPADGIDGSNRYTLESAIAKIPESLRNVGIKCSFLNEAGQVETWEYHGGSYLSVSSWIRSDISAVNEKIDSQKAEVDAAKNEAMSAIDNREQEVINNFNAQRVTPEMLSEATKQLINSSGGGTVTNLPDDEDITSTGGDTPVLKFKDRGPDHGKGYVILRRNKTFAEQVTQANTIYEIRYDFDLEGETVSLPDNCVLNFKGGRLSNGTIEGNKTNIISEPINIFQNNIEVVGNWAVSSPYIEWMGEEILKEKNKIEAFLEVFKSWKLLPHKIYTASASIDIPADVLISGENSVVDISNSVDYFLKPGYKSVIRDIAFVTKTEVTPILIDGTYISATRRKYNLYIYDNVGFSIETGNSNIYLNNIAIYLSTAIDSDVAKAIRLVSDTDGYWNVRMSNILITGKWKWGIYLEAKNDGWITDCDFSYIKMNTVKNGIYLEGGIIQNIKFNEVSLQFFPYTGWFMYIKKASNIVLKNCIPWDYANYTEGKNKKVIYIDVAEVRNVVLNQDFDGENRPIPVEFSDNSVDPEKIFSIVGYRLYPHWYTPYAYQGYDSINYDTPCTFRELFKFREGFNQLGYTGTFAKWLNLKNFNNTLSSGTVFLERISPTPQRSIFKVYVSYVKKKTLDTCMYWCFYDSIEGDTMETIPEWHRSNGGIGALDTRDFSIEDVTNDSTGLFPIVDYANKKLKILYVNETTKILLTPDGYPDVNRKGDSSARPNIVDSSVDVVGLTYFDTTLGKPVFWTGEKWVDANGTEA